MYLLINSSKSKTLPLPPLLNYTVSQYDDSIPGSNNSTNIETSLTSASPPSAKKPSQPSTPSHPNEPSQLNESSIAKELSNLENESNKKDPPSQPEEHSQPSPFVPILEGSEPNTIAEQGHPDSDSLNTSFPSLETQPVVIKQSKTSKYFEDPSQPATAGLSIPFTQPSSIPLGHKLKRKKKLSSSELKTMGFCVKIKVEMHCRIFRLRRNGEVDGSRNSYRIVLRTSKTACFVICTVCDNNS